jgi:hypothetical protein
MEFIKILASSVILIISGHLMAQSIDNQKVINMEISGANALSSAVSFNNKVYADIEGSYYVNDEFLQGEVSLFSDNTLYVGLLVKLNLLNYQTVLQVKEDFYTIDADKIRLLRIYYQNGSDTLTFYNTSLFNHNFGFNGLIEKFEGNGAILFKRRSVTERVYDSTVPYTSNKSYVKYTPKVSYFLFANDKLVEVTTGKNLIKEFPELSSLPNLKMGILREEAFLFQILKSF